MKPTLDYRMRPKRTFFVIVLLSMIFGTSCEREEPQRSRKLDQQSDWIPLEMREATNDSQRFAQRIKAIGGWVWFGKHPPLASSDDSPAPPTLKQWESAATSVTGIQMHPEQTRDLTELVHFESIDELNLDGSFLSDEAFADLPVLKNLETLCLGLSEMSGDGLKHLQSLPKLETLQIIFCERLQGESLVHLKELAPLRNLLITNGSPIDDTTLTSIGTLSQLRVLELGARSNLVNCKSLMPLLPLKDSLETLCLTGIHLSDLDLDALVNFTQLRQLEMHNSQADDSTTAIVGKIKSLERLTLSGEVTDEGLKHLGSLTNLRELSISTRGVRGYGLTYLSDLKALRTLRIYVTPENQHYVDSLRAKLPDCRINRHD